MRENQILIKTIKVYGHRNLRWDYLVVSGPHGKRIATEKLILIKEIQIQNPKWSGRLKAASFSQRLIDYGFVAIKDGSTQLASGIAVAAKGLMLERNVGPAHDVVMYLRKQL